MKFESLPIPGEIFIIGYLLAFIISFAITLFLIRFPLKSSSSQITSSGEKKITSFGGISVILAFLATLWFFQLTGLIDSGHIQLISIISLSTVIMMLLGICDDIFNCSARLKLTIQILIALSLIHI